VEAVGLNFRLPFESFFKALLVVACSDALGGTGIMREENGNRVE